MSSALTFPRVVADLDETGWPFYAAVMPDAPRALLWFAIPVLPFTATWADEDQVRAVAEDGYPVTVIDEDAVTELLYTSALADGPYTPAELAAVVDSRLYAYRCRVPADPAHDEPHRLAACRAWARELIGGTA